MNKSGADCVDANPLRCISQRGTFGKANNTVLCSMVRSPLRPTQDTANRRTVHNRSASLLTHLLELILHTAPDPTKVNPRNPVKILSCLVGGIGQFILYACIIVGSI